MKGLIKVMAAMSIMLIATGCTKRVYVPVQETVICRDSIRSVTAKIDSVIIRDSVITLQRGDTVYKEAWRVRERVKLLRDTLRQLSTDTIYKERIVEVQASAKGGSSWKSVLFWAAIVAAVLMALRLVKQ